MDISEFEKLLKGKKEAENLEFKGAMGWDVQSLAKDILAMSNTPSGGVIIVGIEDKTCQGLGLDEDQLKSFDLETMQDQIRNYADPFVKFSLEKFLYSDGKRYVIIKVEEFQEIPVIAKIDSKGIKAGTIYYRPSSGRPQSAPISNSGDMRDLLARALVKLANKSQTSGSNNTQNIYDEELSKAELEGDEIYKQIKTSGYWKIRFTPLEKVEKNFDELENAIRNSQVEDRAPFPSIDRNKSGSIKRGCNYIIHEFSEDMNSPQLWCFFKSTQFIYFRRALEDDPRVAKGDEEKYILIRNVVLTMREILEFLCNLHGDHHFYTKGVTITIDFMKTKDRQLLDESSGRFKDGIFRGQSTAAKEIHVETTVEPSDLQDVTQISDDLSWKFFEYFAWHPPKETLDSYQN